MNKRTLEQYKEEFENMSYCDLADEFNEPLISITKSQDNLLKIIYINYAKEKDKYFELQERINKAIEYIKERTEYNQYSDVYPSVLDSREVKNILKILKGED